MQLKEHPTKWMAAVDRPRGANHTSRPREMSLPRARRMSMDNTSRYGCLSLVSRHLSRLPRAQRMSMLDTSERRLREMGEHAITQLHELEVGLVCHRAEEATLPLDIGDVAIVRFRAAGAAV